MNGKSILLIGGMGFLGTYNASSGNGVSISSLINFCNEITGRALQVVHESAPNTVVHSIVLNSTRLTAETRWQPRMGSTQRTAPNMGLAA